MKAAKFLKLTPVIMLLITVLFGACNKTDNVIGPQNQVSFQISQRPGFIGGTQFLFKPSVDVKISQIISRYQAQQFADTLNYTNTNYVYSKDTTYIINEYNGVQAGQSWQFSMKGSLPNQNNSGYTITSNYTAQ